MTSDFESFHFFPVLWNKLHKNGVLSQLWNSARIREGGAIYQNDVDVFATFSIIEVFLSISFLWGLKNFWSTAMAIIEDEFFPGVNEILFIPCFLKFLVCIRSDPV